MNHPLSKLGLICAAALCMSVAQAAPVLTLVPQTTHVYSLQNLRLDVVVSGLHSGGTDVLLSAFDLTLSYDASVFQFLQIGSSLGTALGDPNDTNQTAVFANTGEPGVLRFFELSLLEESSSVCTFCIGPYLADLQPSDSFKLASLLFYRPAHGPNTLTTAKFGVESVQLSDGGGQFIGRVGTQDATVDLPEPASLALVGLGLWALNWNRRGRRTGRPSGSFVFGKESS
jgi:hypothetical protein